MDKKSFGTLTNILVNEKSRENLPTNVDRTKQTVLPPGSATPGSGGRDIGKFEFNTPDKPNGKPLQPRTRGLPGEEYGNPSKDDYNQVTRRTMTGTLISLIAFQEALEEDALLGETDFSDEDEREEFKQWKRQKKQRGRKKFDSKKYYRNNRHKLKNKSKKHQRKPKTKLKNKKRRKRNKNRNTKRRASVFSVVSMYLRGR